MRNTKGFLSVSVLVVLALVLVGAGLYVSQKSIKVAVTKPLSQAASLGPEITYLGIANADGSVPKPTETLSDGTLVFNRSVAGGFLLIVEAKPGSSGQLPGTKLNVTTGTPDLQVVSDQKLGDGSTAVCDKPLGGIPAVNPLSSTNTNVLREFGCRFLVSAAPVTKNNLGAYAYVTSPKPTGLRQYNMTVTGALAFPNPSEAKLQVSVRDEAGNMGTPKMLKLRIGNVSTVPSGTLNVTIDVGTGGSLVYRLVSPSQNVELIKIRYSATSEDINIKRVALQLSSAGSNSPINLLNQEVTLWDGMTQVGSAVIDSTSDTATSTLFTVVKVPNGGSKIITVKGTIAAITASGPMVRSGDLLKVDYDGNNLGVNGNYGAGASSSSVIIPMGTDTKSNGVRIMKAYPELAHEALTVSERTLVAGDGKALYKFKVTAKNGDIALAKVTFRVTRNTNYSEAKKFGLYAFTDSGFSSVDSNFSSSNNPGGLINAGNCYSNSGYNAAVTNIVEIYPATTGCNNGTTSLTVPSGESRWFKLTGSVANIAPAGTSDSIAVQMEGDAAAAFGTKTLLQATYRALNGNGDNGVEGDINNDFIWSPRSTTTAASLFDLDWTNGYGVSGLPSSNMTPETISK